MSRNVNDLIKNLPLKRQRKIKKRATELIGLSRKRKANRRKSSGE